MPVRTRPGSRFLAVAGLWLAGAVVIGLVVALVAHASGSGGTASGSASGSTGAVDPVGKIIAVDASRRMAARPLAGPLLGGGTYDLSAHAGHVTVVTAWGSWCEPCRAELPVLRRLAAATYGAPEDFLGIDVEDTVAGARAMVAQYSIPYPSLFDADRSLYTGFAPTLAGDGTPGTVVIDARGRVAGTVIGPVDEAAMTTFLRQLVAERP